MIDLILVGYPFSWFLGRVKYTKSNTFEKEIFFEI